MSNEAYSDVCFFYRLVLETDAQTIAGRVTMRGAEGEVPLAEQVIPSLHLDMDIYIR